MTIRRGYADTPLGQLHYARAGDGDVLLMLHQTPRSHDEFAELQPQLADSYRTIAMDMPGFGSSAPLASPMTIEALAEGGWALLDSLGAERAVLLGHHTGAAVAQEMAVQGPSVRSPWSCPPCHGSTRSVVRTVMASLWTMPLPRTTAAT